jgi:hypothetical protein
MYPLIGSEGWKADLDLRDPDRRGCADSGYWRNRSNRRGYIMTEATPDPIMRIALGFMAAKHLFVASEIGFFNALA